MKNIFEKFMGKGKKDSVPEKTKGEEITNPKTESQGTNERINVKEIGKNEEEAAEAAIERFKEHIRENTNPKYAHREEEETVTDKDDAEKTEE